MVNKKKIISPPPSLLSHHLLLSLSPIPIIVTKTWLTLISHSNSNSYLALLYPTSPSQTPSYYYSFTSHPIPFHYNSLSSFLLYLFFTLFSRCLRHSGFTFSSQGRIFVLYIFILRRLCCSNCLRKVF